VREEEEELEKKAGKVADKGWPGPDIYHTPTFTCQLFPSFPSPTQTPHIWGRLKTDDSKIAETRIAG
jgi:hypothetical protein